MAICSVCFRHCSLTEGRIGFCGARICRDGQVVAANYGLVTALAMDPIEKKPLARFYPGSRILSVGSFGCNLRCPFCQNHDISWSEEALSMIREAEAFSGNETVSGEETASARAGRVEYISPEDLAATAAYYRNRGNIGVAFTYNEPLIGWEYIRDTARLVREMGMKNVLVTNGTAETAVFETLAPYIDAMNIDLKGFTDHYYNDVLHGSRQMVMDLITLAVKSCHVELTTLIVPGENDSEDEIRELSAWVASLTDTSGQCIGRTIPLHLSRFFPRFHMQDRPATDVKLVYRLADIARKKLDYVYTGNC